MLILWATLKALAEVFILALLVQGVLRLVLRDARDTNFAYRMVSAIARPPQQVARVLVASFMPARLHGVVAALIVLALWVAATQFKVELCKGEASGHPMCVEIARLSQPAPADSK